LILSHPRGHSLSPLQVVLGKQLVGPVGQFRHSEESEVLAHLGTVW